MPGIEERSTRKSNRLKKHLQGIPAHCKYPIHTGILEGINNKFDALSLQPTKIREEPNIVNTLPAVGMDLLISFIRGNDKFSLSKFICLIRFGDPGDPTKLIGAADDSLSGVESCIGNQMGRELLFP